MNHTTLATNSMDFLFKVTASVKVKQSNGQYSNSRFSFQCLRNIKLINIQNSNSKAASVLLNILTKLVRNSVASSAFHQIKLLQISPNPNHVKTGLLPRRTSAFCKAMLLCACREVFYKELKFTEISGKFFEIYIIGLERDGPLLKKEVLWKK